jgi:hypothetical protein
MDFTAVPDRRGVSHLHTPAHADRHNGQLENAQRLQLVQAVADFLPNGARARNADTPSGAARRSRPVHVRQGKSTSSMTLNRPAEDGNRSAAITIAAADSRQADYFLRLLVENCRQVDRRIDEYQRAIATAETRGAVERARDIGRLMVIKKHERQTVQALIDRLERRFSLLSRGGVPSPSPECRSVAR